MSNPNEEDIVKGWAEIAKDFELRPLNEVERLQLERTLTLDAITQKYGVTFQGMIK